MPTMAAEESRRLLNVSLMNKASAYTRASERAVLERGSRASWRLEFAGRRDVAGLAN